MNELTIQEIVSNIRKNNLKDFFRLLIPTVAINSCLVLFLTVLITDGITGESLFLTCLMALFGIPFFVITIKKIRLAINPLKSDVLKKYGNVEQIKKIYNEISSSKEYEDDQIVVSKNFICNPRRVDMLIACDDVLGIHKLVHKTNFIIDYYEVIIIDKFVEHYHVRYDVKDSSKADELIQFLSKKCKNAEIGYTDEEWKNIQENRQDINKYNAEYNSKEDNLFKTEPPVRETTITTDDLINNNKEIKNIDMSNVKYCSKCGSVIDSQTKKCTGCGKQYFKGFKVSSVIIILLTIALAIMSYLYVNKPTDNGLDESRYETYKERYELLEEEMAELKRENANNSDKLEFMDDYVACVEDDGTNYYHRYECEDFAGEDFWIYNIDWAEQDGYKPCPKCH